VSRRDDERVADILDAADEVAEIVGAGRDVWDKDRIRQLAVERLLEIICEAANALTEDFRSQHPGVPWRDIIGLRIVLALHYHRVDPSQVWAIAATEVPDSPATSAPPHKAQSTNTSHPVTTRIVLTGSCRFGGISSGV
jgi:uncharacterized protein with HEPN domain